MGCGHIRHQKDVNGGRNRETEVVS